MGKTNYTYAVARIRVLETALFTSAVIEQLLACKTEEQCIQFLQEKGWGDMNTSESAEAILNREQEKIWETIRELGVDMKVFDVLSYPNLFHNLKAAIKDACTEEHGKNLNIYYEDTSISPDEMLEIVKNKEFSRLPAFMAEAAREAYEVLLHTRDGQLCDVIVDKALLEAIYAAGKEAKDSIIKDYAESTVAIADIKIAVRSQKTAKTMDFMKRAMAECESLNVAQLAKAAIEAGIKIMMKELGIVTENLDRVSVAGAFGSYIRTDSAVILGSLPDVPKSKIYSLGNSAGIGASMMLLSENMMKAAETAVNDIMHIELADRSDFQEEYLMAMMF